MQLLKRLYQVGLGIYGVLLVYAVVLYKERMVLPDDANYLFDMVVQEGGFAVFHHRFIAVLTQVLPVLGIELGASLAVVAQLYSLGIVVFYFVCYLVCGAWLKDYKAALALLVSGLLITTHSFYWSVSELGQGIALFFVVVALLVDKGEGRNNWPIWKLGLLSLLVLTVAFSHGLMLFILTFLLAFLWIDKDTSRRVLLAVGIAYLIALVLKSVFASEAYDRQSMSGLRNFLRLFPNYFGTESMAHFGRQLIGPYVWLPVVWLIVCSYYFVRKSWWKLGLVLSYSLGYLLLATVAFPKVQGNGFYNENLFLPLAVFVSVPLIYDVLVKAVRPFWISWVAAMVCITGLLRIWTYREFYQSRLSWQRSILDRYAGQKVVIGERHFPKDSLMMSWSSPYEFWLLSTLERDTTASILITTQPEQYGYGTGNSQLFLPTFGTFTYQDLPKPYFRFRDTVSAYRIVP